MNAPKITALVKKFLDRKMSLDELIKKTGKSRASVYRYLKIIHEGGEIEDKRKYGNNRKY